MTPVRKTCLIACMSLVLALAAGAPWFGLRADPKPKDAPVKDPDKVLAALKKGNARFVAAKRTLSINTSRDGRWRKHLTRGQQPLAAVLCCADSRICLEFIFDQHLGSFFGVRNAGNVVDDSVLASMEYAVEHLHVPVVLVMGHKGCGAIQAVNAAGRKPLPHHLKAIQKAMAGLLPEIEKAKGDRSAKFLDRLAMSNARQQALRLLRESEVIGTAARKGQVRIVIGLYDMEEGSLRFQDVKLPKE